MEIVLRGVVKRFGGVTAVDDATLDIADGELFTLLGPSGCGKTTLLRLIAGFYRPEHGVIRFGDRVVNDTPPHVRNIGMVFQNYALWPHMTVFQNVAYGLRLRRLGRAAVMRDGRVVQLGTPRELYERPRTRFVADFVGINNLIAGSVERADGETLVV